LSNFCCKKTELFTKKSYQSIDELLKTQEVKKRKRDLAMNEIKVIEVFMNNTKIGRLANTLKVILYSAHNANIMSRACECIS